MASVLSTNSMFVTHAGVTRSLLVYSGLPVQEFSQLLSSLFSLETPPTALCDLKNGLVVATSIACRFPESLAGGSFRMVFNDDDSSSSESESSVVSDSDEESAGFSDEEILSRFIGALAGHRFVTAAERAALLSRIQAHDTQAFEALQRYKSTGDVLTLRNSLLQLVRPPPPESSLHDRALSIIATLETKGLLTADDEAALQSVLTSGNDLVEAAMEAFTLDGDEAELADTLSRVARLNASQSRPLAPEPESGELRRIVADMVAAEELSSDQQETLESLVASENKFILAAVELFMATGDVEDLKDTLRRVAKIYTAAAFANKPTSLSPEQTSSATQADAALSAAAAANLLSPQFADQAKALAQAEDQVVLAALDVFVTDGDLTEMADTLSRYLSRVHSADTTTEPSSIVEDPRPIPPELLSVVQRLVRSSTLSPSVGAGLVQGFARGDVRMTAIWEVFRATSDEAELADSLTRLATVSGNASPTAPTESIKHKPATAVTVLTDVVALMESTGSAGPREVQALRGLIAEGADSVFAAFDVFALDGDSAELVDSLRRAAMAAQPDSESERDKRSARSDEEAASQTSISPEDSNPGGVRVPLEQTLTELDEFITALLEDGALTQQQAGILHGAVASQDPRIMAAHDVYVYDQDVDDLVHSLIVLATSILTVSEAPVPVSGGDGVDGRPLTAAGGRRTRPSGDETVGTPPSLQTVAEDEPTLEELRELLSALCVMADQGLISQQVLSELRGAVAEEDPRLLATMDLFGETQDVHDLSDSLQRIAALRASQRETNAAFAAEADSSEPTKSFESELYTLIMGMELSSEESAGLRRIVASNDPMVRAALQVYKLERDAEDLKDTLKRIARRAAIEHQETLAEDTSSDGMSDSDTDSGEADGALNASLSVLHVVCTELQALGSLTKAQSRMLEHAFQAGHPLVGAAIEVFLVDGDKQELADTLLRVARRAS